MATRSAPFELSLFNGVIATDNRFEFSGRGITWLPRQWLLWLVLGFILLFLYSGIFWARRQTPCFTNSSMFNKNAVTGFGIIVGHDLRSGVPDWSVVAMPFTAAFFVCFLLDHQGRYQKSLHLHVWTWRSGIVSACASFGAFVSKT